MISSNLKKRFFTSAFLLFSIYLAFVNNLFMIFLLMIIGIFSLIEFFNINGKINKKSISRLFFNFIFSIFIFILFTVFFIFYNSLISKVVIYCLLLTCISSDIGGFIFGKFFKGKKLTKISPNKTVSGAIGSVILSCGVFSILVFVIFGIFSLNIILIGAVTSIACQLGDLFFSFLKRKAKLKDTGAFLPGHGGVLDRIDGILLGLPIGFLILFLIYQQ